MFSQQSAQILDDDRRVVCMRDHPQQEEACIINTYPPDEVDPAGGDDFDPAGGDDVEQEADHEAPGEERGKNKGAKTRLGRRGGCRRFVAKDCLQP